YSKLAPLANQWFKILNLDIRYPSDHEQLIHVSHNKNQIRPTPLILKYEAGGYNTLHQDLYGEVYFPFQVVFILTQVGKDHEGGELVMVEQVPRAQSKATVIRPNLGDAVIFTTNFLPVKGTKGYYRAKMKHGVSEVKSGNRFALGIIFHDAQ
ncbi:2OG-Fe(II) oxygenase, partial [bacterium]|nr:2OG-Fe(II) oxygenase [bacterium]